MGHATTTIANGLANALARQHGALERRWSAARDGDAKAVHRGRVASRRLREVLSVIHAAYRHSHAGQATRSVRRLTRALGPVRELDVALVELDRAVHRHGWADELAGVFRRRLVQQREHRATRLSGKMDKRHRADLRDEVRRLMTRVSAADERSWQAALSGRVVRRARAVLAAAAEAGTLYVPDRLHALRIAIKKLRYALELLPPTAGLDVAEALRVLKRAQRRFGALQDVQGLLTEVRAIDWVASRPDRAALVAAADDLDRDCREIHAQALILVPDVEACARLVRAELGVRRRGRRLAMAKATLDEKVPEVPLTAGSRK
jgi:CHAD domain-containing protein